MYAEQAHNRCPSCLYYEPCCDGAPQLCRSTKPEPHTLAATPLIGLDTPVAGQHFDEA